MIVLDTNVVSAMMHPIADLRITAWLDNNPREMLWLTSISVFEIRTGIELLPEGKRKRGLDQLFEHALRVSLEGKVLQFDEAAARAASALTAARRRQGRPVEWRDTQIAGIVLSRGARLATGNLRHFDDLGQLVIDPWA